MPDADLTAIFHALADDKRRAMVAQLAAQPLSVKDLAEPLDMALPSAVKHLNVLETSGLVTSQKQGRVRTYAIRSDAFHDINGWIARRERAMNAAFDRMEQFIADLPKEPDT